MEAMGTLSQVLTLLVPCIIPAAEPLPCLPAQTLHIVAVPTKREAREVISLAAALLNSGGEVTITTTHGLIGATLYASLR